MVSRSHWTGITLHGPAASEDQPNIIWKIAENKSFCPSHFLHLSKTGGRKKIYTNQMFVKGLIG